MSNTAAPALPTLRHSTPFGRLRDFRLQVALVSLLLLLPCFWGRRIEAGDLSSHIYNTWLAEQVELGKAPGLTVVPLKTNVLFDLALESLYRRFGAEAAQRVAVCASVLIFTWGAFAFLSAVNGRRMWSLMPCLFMLAYGWAFHAGFFNFYLSAGLSLCALALFWAGGPKRILAAAALLCLASVAHTLGAAWAVAIAVYTWIARRGGPRFRLLLLGVSLCAVAGLRLLIVARYPTFWSPHQVLEASAVDQFWVFGIKYWAISVCMALLWGFLFLRVTYAVSALEMFAGAPFQLCLITSAGVLLIPTRVELPGYSAALSFITERMTLLLGVMICAFLGAAKPTRWLTGSFMALAGVYFSFLYADTRALNAAEARVEALLQQLPPGQRVFSSLSNDQSRVPLWPHAVDRACLGRCIAYNNYEPFSGAFRVRVNAENPLVVSAARDYYALELGGYKVRERDLPLYQIQACESGNEPVCLKALHAGEVTRAYSLSLLPLLWR